MTRGAACIGITALFAVALLPRDAHAQTAEDAYADLMVPPQSTPTIDLVATNDACTRSGAPWIMTNPSPGRFFCGMRMGSALVGFSILSTGVAVYTIAGGDEAARTHATWMLLDAKQARLLGPVARNMTIAVDDRSAAFILLEVQDSQTIMTVVPRSSDGYAELRQTVRDLGGQAPLTPGAI